MISKTLFRFDPAIPLFLHSAEGSEGGGSETPKAPNPDAEKIAAEVQRKFDAQSAKHSGDLTAALLDQIKKTHAAENGKSTLQTQVNELKQQVPDEATKARLAAYEALGTPEEIVSQRETLERDANEAKQLRVEELAAGVDFDGKTLADLAQLKGFRVEEREGTGADGKPTKIPVAVYRNGEKDEEKPLVEYVESTLPNYLPSLKLNAVQVQQPEPQYGGAWIPQGIQGKTNTGISDPTNAALAAGQLY